MCELGILIARDKRFKRSRLLTIVCELIVGRSLECSSKLRAAKVHHICKMCYLMTLPGLLFASISMFCQVKIVNGDLKESIYNSVFRFSRLKMTPLYVTDVLSRLDAIETGFSLDDPRKMQVFFWKAAATDTESKCTREDDEQMLARLEQDRSIAEEEKRRTNSRNKYFNLEYYVEDLRSNRFIYCQNTVGNSFIRALNIAVAGDGADLNHLTVRMSAGYSDANRLGERIGQLISRKSDQRSFIQLLEWWDDIDYVKKNYELYSPCAGVMKTVQEYEGYYGLVTLPGNHWKCKLELREWLDRIAVCKFIDQSSEVFERTAHYLHDTDRFNKRKADSPQRAIINDDRYNSIFRFSQAKLSASYVTVALSLLESYRWGLAAGDPRRAEVSFWVDAARQDESKCRLEFDEAIRSQLERERSKASRVRRSGSHRREELNLESYVEYVRSEQLLYCESRFGAPFLNALTELSKSNFVDICLLTTGYTNASTVDVEELGKRVARLVSNDSGREPSRSVDPVLIRGQYSRHSPCVGLLEIARRYEGYYGLMTAPDNYQRVRPVLRNWIDKISVCRLIDESDEVFQVAAEYLQAPI